MYCSVFKIKCLRCFKKYGLRTGTARKNCHATQASMAWKSVTQRHGPSGTMARAGPTATMPCRPVGHVYIGLLEQGKEK